MCACGNYYHLLPNRLFIKCAVVVAVLILALHGDIAAYRQNTHRILCFALFTLENSRPHTYGKLINLYFKELCKKEMAALVYHNYHAEEQNCHGNSPYLAPNPRGSYAE